MQKKSYVHQRSFMEAYKKLKLTGKREEVPSEPGTMFLANFSSRKVRSSLNFRAWQDLNQLEMSIYYDFVDRFIVKPLRRPEFQLPTQIIDE